MLVLTRELQESITIGDEVVVTLLSIKRGCVQIGVDAPSHIAVHREEIYQRLQAQKKVRITQRRPRKISAP